MVAHPLITVTRARACENIEAQLTPRVQAVRNFNGLVPGMLSGLDTIHFVFRARKREVVVQLHHSSLGRYRVGTVNLNFIIVLRQRAAAESQNYCERGTRRNILKVRENTRTSGGAEKVGEHAISTV